MIFVFVWQSPSLLLSRLRLFDGLAVGEEDGAIRGGRYRWGTSLLKTGCVVLMHVSIWMKLLHREPGLSAVIISTVAK